jgi:serine/threonine protein kinase
MLGGLCSACMRRIAFAAPSMGNSTAAGTFPERVFGTWEPPLASEVAEMLPRGSYSVEKLIGRGGMGAVYQGMQLSLKRPVAIKLMRQDHGADEGFRLRFQREALLLASLDHPGIVKVIDCGQAGPDLLYIVMELVDGVNLMEVIRSGGVSEKRALDIVDQVCSALRFAHDSGIVHRDIKPSNILLARDGRVRIADFGLAIPLDPEGGNSADPGIGTPCYAAPEQLRADGLVDQRADLFAVGVMIYQMLTGQLPQGDWKPPSELVAVDPAWDKIVSKAVESVPQDRISGVEVMQEMLSRISPVDPERIRRKRSKFLAIGFLLFVALLAVAFIVWNQASQAPRYPVPKAWVDATPELRAAAARYGFGVMGKNGMEITEEAHLDLADRRVFDDVAIRVTYSGGLGLGMRGTNDEYYFGVIRPDGEAVITMGFLYPDTRPNFKPANFSFGKSYDPSTKHELVFAAKGDILQLWLDGKLVTTLKDETLKSGMLALRVKPKPEAPTSIMRVEYAVLGNQKLPAAQPNQGFKPKPGTIAHRLTSPDFKWGAPTLLGHDVNSAADDASPHISPDSLILTYQSSRDGFLRFYECRRSHVNEPFSDPKVLPGMMVNWAGCPWISSDRRTLLFISPNGPDHKGSTQDIYMSRRTDPNLPWGPMVNLQTVNSFTHDQSPCLTSDGLTLYFGSLRRGGFGGHDLWRASRKTQDAPFTDITNLGSSFNTFIQERNMYLAADDRTLLFVRMFAEDPWLDSALHVAVPDGKGAYHVEAIDLPVKGMITDPCVSPDGGTLWFAWKGPVGQGGHDIWQIQRVPKQTKDITVEYAALASRDTLYQNSLGMRFIPVPITGGTTAGQSVLFSIWETRVADFAVFVKETGHKWPGEHLNHGAMYPAARLSWQHAQTFCQWLTDRERRMGKIPAGWRYRLPSDHEWSCAAGIGDQEDPDMPVAEKSGWLWNAYAWGDSWPPPENAANLAGEEALGLIGKPDFRNFQWVINRYRDPFVETAPVASFPKNPNGLYDISGNVWEWCEDLRDPQQNRRVMRGHSFLCNNGDGAKLSVRGGALPDQLHTSFGLRVVLAPEAIVKKSVSETGTSK